MGALHGMHGFGVRVFPFLELMTSELILRDDFGGFQMWFGGMD